MKTEREMFEESNNIKPDWSFKFDDELQQYVELDHEMQAQVEEFNEHWDTFRAGWKAAKAQVVPDTYTPIVLALEDVQSKIAKTSFLTMDEENENEVMAVNANELAAYIDELIEAQEPTND